MVFCIAFIVLILLSIILNLFALKNNKHVENIAKKDKNVFCDSVFFDYKFKCPHCGAESIRKVEIGNVLWQVI
jgi:hypothetical protein